MTFCRVAVKEQVTDINFDQKLTKKTLDNGQNIQNDFFFGKFDRLLWQPNGYNGKYSSRVKNPHYNLF